MIQKADRYKVHDYTTGTILYDGCDQKIADVLFQDMRHIHVMGIEYIYELKPEEVNKKCEQ